MAAGPPALLIEDLHVVTPALLSHAELAEHLARAAADLDAAEVHGLASGLLAGDIESGDRLVSEVLPQPQEGDLVATECRATLQRLVKETEAGLRDESLQFTPLLPDDSTPLRERVQALRDWCESFLYGLGVGSRLPEKLPPGLAEALEDVGELTRLDVADMGDTEAEEQAFTELVEFLRVATLLIRDELNAQASRVRTADD